MSRYIELGFASESETADAFIKNVDVIVTGAVHWVDSVSGSDGNPGTENEPLATLQQAITNATANNGDIILVKAGHTQSVSSVITIAKAGLKIFGLGITSGAPNFTCTAAIDLFNITANDVEINNFYLPVGTTIASTAKFNIDAANVRIKGCTILQGQYDPAGITITANGVRAQIVSNTFTVSADGPDYGIHVESASATGLYVYNNAFNGGSYNWDVGAIYSNVAHLNFVYDSNTQTGNAQINHNAAAKGFVSNPICDTGSVVAA